MQPESKDDGKSLTHFPQQHSRTSFSVLSQCFDVCQPPELLDVEIRKTRAKVPNKRPPSIDFLKRSKETTMDTTEGEFRPIAERRLSFQKADIPFTRTPSVRRVESFAPPKQTNAVPQWLQELRRRKKMDSDETNTTKTVQNQVVSDPAVSKNQENNKSTPVEKKPTPSCVISEAKSDYSATGRRISKSRSNKTHEAKPTLTELQKGAEKINKSIAELQRDMQILLEQIKQAQIEQ